MMAYAAEEAMQVAQWRSILQDIANRAFMRRLLAEMLQRPVEDPYFVEPPEKYLPKRTTTLRPFGARKKKPTKRPVAKEPPMVAVPEFIHPEELAGELAEEWLRRGRER